MRYICFYADRCALMLLFTQKKLTIAYICHCNQLLIQLNIMKKLVLAVVASVMSLAAIAQNVQLHYDFEREAFTSTVEMFKLDDLGSTFFFIDFDYGYEDPAQDVESGVNLAYMELARAFQLGDLPVQARVEFDGGFGRLAGVEYGINNCYLVGVEKTWLSKDFSKNFTLQLNYKQIIEKQASFQITGVWGMNFFDNKLTFSGFADFWKEDSDFDYNGTTDAEYIFIAEPQLWYNINPSFSVGGEVEFSNNFGGTEGFMTRPTLAVKWNIAPQK